MRARQGRLRFSTTAVWLAAITGIGLALRIAWVLHLDPLVDVFGVPVSDQGWYYQVATNLANGKGFVIQFPSEAMQATAYRPPAYPLLLAGLWKVVGVHATSAKLLNVALGTATIPLVYAVGRQIFDRRVGLIAAGVYAVLPSAIVWLALTHSEALFTLLFLAALWLILSMQKQRAAGALVLGVLVGLATLTRGQGMLLVPVALLVWVARDGWLPSFRQIGLVMIVAALVITPWTVRNWVVMDAPILISTNTGFNLRIGHSPEATGTFFFLDDPIDGVPARRANQRTEWEVRSYDVYSARALKYAISHPWREIVLAKDKIYHTYKSESGMVDAFTYVEPLRPVVLEKSFAPLLDVSWYLILVSAVVSVPFWVSRQPHRLLPVAVLVLWTSFHIVFFGIGRFHLPLLPLFIIVAVGGTRTGLTLAWTWLQQGRRASPVG